MTDLAPVLLYSLVGLLLLALGAVLGRRWLRTLGRRSILRFRARVDSFKLERRQAVRDELLADPVIGAAIAAHAAAHGGARDAAVDRVERYVDEIVPFFNVLSYYRIGYTLARRVIRLFYRVTVEYEDRAAVLGLPRHDVAVYVANHRSNMDYVVVTYVLAGVVSISYAVGEWARTWPLEHLFKSFGSYFIRRGFREPLYHAVLARYVQLITRHRVTQGIFPEGGLSRDGRIRPPKIGLFDYLLGTLGDPAFAGDIWIVPVGINYDRVLEDRTLTRELIPGARRPWRVVQLAQALGFLVSNGIRLIAGRASRYGRVGICFGTPISARRWFARHAPGALELPRAERLPEIQRFAQVVMGSVGAVVPATAVPVAATALLALGSSVVSDAQVVAGMAEVLERLRAVGVRGEAASESPEALWDRALATFRLRRFVVRQADHHVILPNARPLLEYYANSIAHLLGSERAWELSPATAVDPPTLAPDRRRQAGGNAGGRN